MNFTDFSSKDDCKFRTGAVIEDDFIIFSIERDFLEEAKF